jgi:dihydroorotate dehydrogenase
MYRLIVSAPFGNRLSFPYATSTLGTFTRHKRAGPLKRLWRVFRTVRYYPGLKAWKNRLGLPNPGLAALCERVAHARHTAGDPFTVKDKIVSVAGHCLDDWDHVLRVASGLVPDAIELNCSCPNCPGEDMTEDYGRVFGLAVAHTAGTTTRVIVKLPPVGHMSLATRAVAAGVRSFHCCNTLPTPAGGLSGKPLQALSLRAVEDVRHLLHARGLHPGVVIGGGGVTAMADATRFLAAGATHVSVASVLFFPWAWRRVRYLAEDLHELADRGVYRRPQASVNV